MVVVVVVGGVRYFDVVLRFAVMRFGRGNCVLGYVCCVVLFAPMIACMVSWKPLCFLL